MQIVLDATREEYVAWLREQQGTLNEYHHTPRDNPLSAFLWDFLYRQGVEWYPDLHVYLSKEDEEDEEDEADEEDGVQWQFGVQQGTVRQFAITPPVWMAPLISRYLTGPDTITIPTGALADAEALTNATETQP